MTEITEQYKLYKEWEQKYTSFLLSGGLSLIEILYTVVQVR